MTEYCVYDIRKAGDKHPRDPRPPVENFEKGHWIVTIKGPTSSCGCTEWIEVEFKNGKVTKAEAYKSGCPRHESRSLGAEDPKLWEERIKKYIREEVKANFEPYHINTIGIYTSYYYDSNEKPFIIKVNEETREITPIGYSDDMPVRRIWCRYCIEDCDTCAFHTGKSEIPRCIAETYARESPHLMKRIDNDEPKYKGICPYCSKEITVNIEDYDSTKKKGIFLCPKCKRVFMALC